MLSKLNDEQREAVQTVEGPLLVLAGAGSGKTRVVTFRIVHLMEQGIQPNQILGVTFTNKAAAEMRERIQNLTQHHVLICTFHSLGARILRESIIHLGYKRDFLIYDEEDSDKVLKACMQELGLVEKKIEPKIFKNMISKAKNNLQAPENIRAEDQELEVEKYFVSVYNLYQSKLKEYNALDFDDLLFLPVRLFQEHPQVLEYYQRRWPFLLIDEYQDTNPSQYLMAKLLVSKSNNICVVGDPDQSIYSWRGANMKNILNFEKDFPGAKVVRLEQNYRSRTNILNAANALISLNEQRYEKNLWSALGPGEKIKHFVADDGDAEVAFVTEKVQHHHVHQQIPLSQMVVFYRTNFQSRVFEDVLIRKKIPYVIVGGVSFYQRREIKDILAFLRMVHSGLDYVSFMRTINLPKRGLGEATLDKIRLGAEQEQHSVLEYSEMLVDDKPLKHPLKLTAAQKKGLSDYITIIRELRRIAEATSLTELVRSTIEYTRYLDVLKHDPDTFDDRKQNLDDLIAKAFEWEMKSGDPSLTAFLEELSLKSSLDEAETAHDRLNLMTIHNGKGLEFQVTFMVGMEEFLFPHINSMNNRESLEEERRLCYVGMTRAKEFLYLSSAYSRFLFGTTRSQQPSRFLREIPQEYVEKLRRAIPSFSRPKPVDPFPDDMDQSIPPELEEPFEPGDAILHKEFGTGVVQQVYQGSIGLTYKILFSRDNKEKTLVAKYASLKKL